MKTRYPWIEVFADQHMIGGLAMEAYVDLSKAIVTRNVRCFRFDGCEPEAVGRNDGTFIPITLLEPRQPLSSRTTR